MPNTTARPNFITGAGYLFYAPLGTAAPANTVIGSVFTDAWPVGWVSLGATDNGSDFNYTTKVDPVLVEEFLDPISYQASSREGSFDFAVADVTATRIKQVFNGGASQVTGTTSTTLTSFTPPIPGQEVRAQIGYESLDATVRFIAYQTINGSQVKMSFRKAPAKATMNCSFKFEVPSTGIPWQAWTAGVARG